jgi:hypothetical protein
MDVVKELASDDKAYRSLTLSWFKNSPFRNHSTGSKNGFQIDFNYRSRNHQRKKSIESRGDKTPV